MKRILEFIEEINQKCAEVVKLRKSAVSQYRKEKSTADSEADSLVFEMQSSFETYCHENFETLFEAFYNVRETLSKDYKAEVEGARSSCEEFDRSSIEECQVALSKIVEELNSYISELNATDFDALVPPGKVGMDGDTFYTYTDAGGKIQSYTHQSEFTPSEKPKPLSDLAAKIAVLCRRGSFCVERMKHLYTEVMDIDAYETFVRTAAQSWNAERKNQINNKCEAECYKIMNSSETKDKFDEFFDELYAAARRADVDYRTGTLTDSEEIVIGSTRIKVTDEYEYEKMIGESEILSKRLPNAELIAPVLLDLKKCGNILVELDTTEEYSDTVKRFKDFVGDAVLVGHNIKSCDIPHITRAAKRAGIRFENEYLDTKALAMKHKEAQGWENIKLTTLSSHFGIIQNEAHRAWCDAEANAYVYLKLKALS